MFESFFVFDVESVGLHGEGFAVAGGIYDRQGIALREFLFNCPPEACDGRESDRKWVAENVPSMRITNLLPIGIRNAFWKEWMQAKGQGITMFAECLWPVEARFVIQCVQDDPENRNWDGPYPFMEIASFLSAAGMDVMGTYDRRSSELPPHNPLADARLSARLLAASLDILSRSQGRKILKRMEQQLLTTTHQDAQKGKDTSAV
jgi:hypothetical protein